MLLIDDESLGRVLYHRRMAGESKAVAVPTPER
jgi:hypothetical protein